jgi:hypothetical protein
VGVGECGGVVEIVRRRVAGKCVDIDMCILVFQRWSG